MNSAAKRRRRSVATAEAAGVIGQLRRRTPLASEPSLVDVVAAVHGIPYGRPATRTISGVLAEWRGTCSTKTLLLMTALLERWRGLEASFCDPGLREPFIAALARRYDRGDA